jgi:hypothetical protein
MKVAVLNFSGNVGKTTVAKHLLLPRMNGAQLVSVESINADEGDGERVRGKHFGAVSEQLLLVDSAVLDIGSSNAEVLLELMRRYQGSHEDLDLFVVPTVKEGKQMRDTITTIQMLKAMGVPANKIRVVFNRVVTDDTLEEEFHPLFEFHEETKAFTLRPQAALEFSELYPRLRSYNTTIPELLADSTDYKARLRDPALTKEEKSEAAARISMRRLAGSAQENLDAVFAALTAK